MNGTPECSSLEIRRRRCCEEKHPLRDLSRGGKLINKVDMKITADYANLHLDVILFHRSTLSGIFGIVSARDCYETLIFGTDYQCMFQPDAEERDSTGTPPYEMGSIPAAP